MKRENRDGRQRRENGWKSPRKRVRAPLEERLPVVADSLGYGQNLSQEGFKIDGLAEQAFLEEVVQVECRTQSSGHCTACFCFFVIGVPPR